MSSHTGADDKAGIIGEYVKRGNKAWTAANANPVAVQIELCAFADWTTSTWNQHPAMLENCAKWIAEEAAYWSIPIVKLSAAQAQGSGRGVCQHADLGAWGGGHWDCGSGFPIDKVLQMAKGGGDEEMGYPEWFWDWANWYLTTVRDASDRPPAAPQTIPEWAWDGLDEIQGIGKRYGMTQGERDWIDWYLGGRDPAKRPNVPQTIPDHWWTDEAYVLSRD